MERLGYERGIHCAKSLMREHKCALQWWDEITSKIEGSMVMLIDSMVYLYHFMIFTSSICVHNHNPSIEFESSHFFLGRYSRLSASSWKWSSQDPNSMEGLTIYPCAFLWQDRIVVSRWRFLRNPVMRIMPLGPHARSYNKTASRLSLLHFLFFAKHKNRSSTEKLCVVILIILAIITMTGKSWIFRRFKLLSSWTGDKFSIAARWTGNEKFILPDIYNRLPVREN